MTTREQMLADEQKVVSELIKDPTQDIAIMAEKCGMSKQKVWRIVRSLEKDGSIMSRPASINPKKMGKRSYLVLFERSFKVVDDRLTNEMTMPEMLREIEEQGIKAIVEDSYYLNGAYDWAIILTVEENRDLIKFMELWRKYYGEYFSRVIQSEIMFTATRNSKLNPNLSELGDLLR